MATTIRMPQLGESVAEGTIGKWLKAPGERIERDEALVEVITDKVNAEIPSPVAGVVQRIVVTEGETVPVGAELAIIADPSEAGEPVASPVAPPTEASRSVDVAQPSPSSSEPREQGHIGSVVESGAAVRPGEDGNGSPKRASPLVRRLAREYGVDLSRIEGSGLSGRVTKADILGYIERRGAAPAPAAPAAPPPSIAPVAPMVTAPEAARPAPSAPPAPVPSPAAAPVGPLADDEELIPLTPMRRAIAEHMARSVQTSPHAWGMVEMDVTGLVRLRASLLESWQQREGFELTFLPFFVKAVCEALRESPILNARWSDQGVVLKKRINVGIAAAVKDGLLVPVIRDADQKSIAGLAHAIRDLATRARAGRLTIDDLQGGTITVNNTGALGSIASGPIINQPQAAIITMEAIVKRPTVLADDAIAIRSMMNSCISFDHRVTDGAEALRFLYGVKRRVEAYAPGMSI